MTQNAAAAAAAALRRTSSGPGLPGLGGRHDPMHTSLPVIATPAPGGGTGSRPGSQGGPRPPQPHY